MSTDSVSPELDLHAVLLAPLGLEAEAVAGEAAAGVDTRGQMAAAGLADHHDPVGQVAVVCPAGQVHVGVFVE